MSDINDGIKADDSGQVRFLEDLDFYAFQCFCEHFDVPYSGVIRTAICNFESRSQNCYSYSRKIISLRSPDDLTGAFVFLAGALVRKTRNIDFSQSVLEEFGGKKFGIILTDDDAYQIKRELRRLAEIDSEPIRKRFAQWVRHSKRPRTNSLNFFWQLVRSVKD